MLMWYEKVLRPHMSGRHGVSGLILDDLIVHKDARLQMKMFGDSVRRFMIPLHYTAVIQPCDVGINKSLKLRLQQRDSDWRREPHASLRDGEKLPSPTCRKVLL